MLGIFSFLRFAFCEWEDDREAKADVKKMGSRGIFDVSRIWERTSLLGG